MNGIRTIFAAAMAALLASAQPALAEETATEAAVESPFAAIQQFLDDAVESGQIPAGHAMIARNGELLWQGAAGEMGPDVPMRADAIMPLASVGKLYTATATMILVERGTINLGRPGEPISPGLRRSAHREHGRRWQRDACPARSAGDDPRPSDPYIGPAYGRAMPIGRSGTSMPG